ncbi:MAG: hypothetical protein RL582_1359 [Bacteroidota bacterium]|jgi:hypothetical protein
MSKIKKIKTIHDLREVKAQLLIERLEIENKMRTNWRNVKENMTPKNIIKNVILSALKKNEFRITNPVSEAIGGLFLKSGNKMFVQLSKKLKQWFT